MNFEELSFQSRYLWRLPIDHVHLDIASMPYKRHDFMNINNGAALSCIFIFVYKILIWYNN